MAEFGKAHITPAGDDVVAQLYDFLFQRLMADLGATQHDADVGAQGFELLDQCAGLHRVPDIHSKTDDFRVHGQ